MPTGSFDINELKRRMQGATQSLKHELGGLRTGRAAASMLEPVQVDAYGTHMPLNQLATISVPEPRLLSVQVWDKSMVKAVEKAIIDSNLGLSPATEGQVLRLRIPELNEDRRKELVKVAHKYAEAARVAVRHVRRDGLPGALAIDEICGGSSTVLPVSGMCRRISRRPIVRGTAFVNPGARVVFFILRVPAGKDTL